MKRIPITVDGFKKSREELKYLKTVVRPQVIEAIRAARELGDLSENAEYDSAKEKQSFIEGKIIALENVQANAEVVDISNMECKGVCVFGSYVKLLDIDSDREISFQIVGDIESDVDNGKLSVNSPVARSIIGKTLGDLVEVNTPGGERKYEITQVRYK